MVFFLYAQNGDSPITEHRWPPFHTTDRSRVTALCAHRNQNTVLLAKQKQIFQSKLASFNEWPIQITKAWTCPQNQDSSLTIPVVLHMNQEVSSHCISHCDFFFFKWTKILGLFPQAGGSVEAPRSQAPSDIALMSCGGVERKEIIFLSPLQTLLQQTHTQSPFNKGIQQLEQSHCGVLQ